jgi:phospholipid/cholesterol/gamma-HCH transport system substrate-binding protein
METNVNYTIAGMFVITLVSIIIFAIIWLSAGFSFVQYDTYQVNMNEAVTGLNVDAQVDYNGVTVGKVAKIAINPHNPRLVELLLKIKHDTPITEGTRAKLDVRPLTGVASVALEDQGLNMTPLRKLPHQPYPVILTTPSIYLRLDAVFTQITHSFHQMSEDFQQITASVEKLLDKDNLHSFKETLHSAQNMMHLLELQTVPSANQTVTNMATITGNLSEISAEIKQNPAVLIRGQTQPPLGPGEQ